MKINRNDLIEKLSHQITDAADLDSLMSYFLEGQVDYLESMSDSDLSEYAKEFINLDDGEDLELT
jgi:hypothetical protein